MPITQAEFNALTSAEQLETIQTTLYETLVAGENASKLWQDPSGTVTLPSGDIVDNLRKRLEDIDTEAALAYAEIVGSEAESARDDAQTARDEAQSARSLAQTARDEAQSARDAAISNADVELTLSAGRASVADGEQFTVVEPLELVRYRRDSASTQTELVRMLSTAGAKNLHMQGIGIYMHAVQAEYDGYDLYVKPIPFSGDTAFYSRGGFMPTNLSWNITNVYQNCTDATLPAGCAVAETSPGGLTNCFKLSNANGLYYDLDTETWFISNRARRDNVVPLVVTSYGSVGDCEAQSQINRALSVTDISALETQLQSSKATILIQGTNGEKVDLDRASKTITIPPNSVVAWGGEDRSIPSGATIDVGVYGTTLERIYYVHTSGTWVVIPFDAALSTAAQDTHILVGLCRCPDLANTGALPALSGFGSYTVDGGVLDEQLRPIWPCRYTDNILTFDHRARKLIAPENTLEGLSLGLKAGFGGYELDINITSDGHFVCLHDGTIDRTTGATGDIRIDSLTLAQARTYDYSEGWPDFSPAELPLIEEMLRELRIHNGFTIAEFKFTPTLVQAQEVIDLVEKTKMTGRVIFAAFNGASLDTILQADPDAFTLDYSGTFDPAPPAAPLTEAERAPFITQAIAECAARKTANNKVYYGPPASIVTQDVVEEAWAAGVGIIPYTVTDAATVYALAQMGVDGIVGTQNVQKVLRSSGGLL